MRVWFAMLAAAGSSWIATAAAAAGPPRTEITAAFAPLRGQGGEACARVLADAAEEDDDDAFAAERLARGPPEGGSFRRLERWVRAIVPRRAALVVVGTLRTSQVVLEAYGRAGLIGLTAIRTAGPCGLTRRGQTALRRFLARAAARAAGQDPYAPVTPAGSPPVDRQRRGASTSSATEDRGPTRAAGRARSSSATGGSDISPSGPATTVDLAPSPPARGGDAPPVPAITVVPTSTTASAPGPSAEARGADRAGAPEPPFFGRLRRLRVEVGVGLVTRQLDFGAVADPDLVGMSAPGAGQGRLGFAVRPLTAFEALAGLELRAHHQRTFGGTARGPGDVEARAYGQSESGLAALFAFVLEVEGWRVVLSPKVGLQHFAAAVEGDARGRPPRVDYLSLEGGAELAARLFDAVDATLAASYLLVLDGGGLARPGVLAGAEGGGPQLGARLEYLWPNMGLGLDLRWLGLAFEGAAGPAALSAEDSALSLSAFVSTRY